MKEITEIIPMCVLLVAGVMHGQAAPTRVDDPSGVLK